MLTFTLQHILILKLMIQYNIPSSTVLHYILFLASADSKEKDELGFYDFIKTKTGVYSKFLNGIITSLDNHGLISRKNFSITEEGKEIYYQLFTALQGFDSYPNTIKQIIHRLGNSDEHKLLKEMNTYIVYRKCRTGFKIFPKPIIIEPIPDVDK